MNMAPSNVHYELWIGHDYAPVYCPKQCDQDAAMSMYMAHNPIISLSSKCLVAYNDYSPFVRVAHIEAQPSGIY